MYASYYYDDRFDDDYDDEPEYEPEAEWYDAEAYADIELLSIWEDAPAITAPALIETAVYQFSFNPEAA